MIFNPAKAVPSGHPNLDQWNDLLNEVAEGTGVPANLLKAIVEYESSGYERAIGSAQPLGYGLCQITYGVTVGDDGVPTYHGKNLFDPKANLTVAAVDFLVPLLRQFPWNLEAVVASYNAGPDAVVAALSDGSAPSSAAVPGYVGRVLAAYAWFCR